VKSNVRSSSYRAKEEMRLCGLKLHMQNMTLLRAVARVAIEMTAPNLSEVTALMAKFAPFLSVF
jgi:hypothetical protein